MVHFTGGRDWEREGNTLFDACKRDPKVCVINTSLPRALTSKLHYGWLTQGYNTVRGRGTNLRYLFLASGTYQHARGWKTHLNDIIPAIQLLVAELVLVSRYGVHHRKKGHQLSTTEL